MVPALVWVTVLEPGLELAPEMERGWVLVQAPVQGLELVSEHRR